MDTRKLWGNRYTGKSPFQSIRDFFHHVYKVRLDGKRIFTMTFFLSIEKLIEKEGCDVSLAMIFSLKILELTFVFIFLCRLIMLELISIMGLRTQWNLLKMLLRPTILAQRI